MPLGEPIKLRIDVNLHERLRNEAVLRDIALTEVVREKLSFLERLEDELTSFRRIVEAEFIGLHNRLDELGEGSHGDSSSGSFSVQYETLLLLRKMNGASGINYAHKEMKRQGIPVFNPEKEKD